MVCMYISATVILILPRMHVDKELSDLLYSTPLLSCWSAWNYSSVHSHEVHAHLNRCTEFNTTQTSFISLWSKRQRPYCACVVTLLWVKHWTKCQSWVQRKGKEASATEKEHSFCTNFCTYAGFFFMLVEWCCVDQSCQTCERVTYNADQSTRQNHVENLGLKSTFVNHKSNCSVYMSLKRY